MPMGRSWSQRWNRIKADVTVTDLCVDVSGKILLALGLGAIFARSLAPYASGLIIVGLLLSAAAKAKYWKRFWAP